MVMRGHSLPAVHLALLVLCLAFPIPASVSVRHSPSGGDKPVKLGAGETKYPHPDHGHPHPDHGHSKSFSQEHDGGPLNENTEENVNDCFSLPDSTDEACEFEERELVDYGPPTENTDVQPGGPIT